MRSVFAEIPDERQLVIREEPFDISELGANEIVVEAEASVVSAGTELAIYTALAPGVRTPGSWNAYPFRPGYGLVGRVRATGSQATRVSNGARVLCFGEHASLQVVDISGDSPRKSAFVLDEELSIKAAAMLRIALIARSAPLVTEFEAGDLVCVFGLGSVGNLAAQLYQLGGARVIGFDPVPARCDLAHQMGIETVLSVSPAEQVAAVRELSGGRGVQVAVDAVGHSAVVMRCIQVCAPHGQVILLGSPRAAYEGNLTDAFRLIHNHWLVMRGALEWQLPAYPTPGVKHSIQSSLEMLTGMVRRAELNVEDLITHVITPDELPAAYRGLLEDNAQYVGVVVDWRGMAN